MFWAFCPSSSSSSSSSFSFSNNYATLFHPNFTDFDTPSFQIKIMWALPVRMNASSSDFSEKELNETIINNPDYACTGDQRSDFIPLPKLQGYRCKCKDGFVGDGYANGTGCTGKNICQPILRFKKGVSSVYLTLLYIGVAEKRYRRVHIPESLCLPSKV